MAHIIVVGNEKGGSGKSTTTMHLATALARMGHRVGGLDLDLRQKTFGQYVTNRIRYAAQSDITLQSPNYIDLPEIAEADLNPGENLMDRRLSAAVELLEPQSDFIVIDCPGSHTRLSQMAHAMANTLITPLNDSFVDFDLLAKIESDASGSSRCATRRASRAREQCSRSRSRQTSENTARSCNPITTRRLRVTSFRTPSE